ncbi:hypothetical protein L0F63_006699, partial [Massospora cicadina]
NEKLCPAHGRLPDASQGSQHVKDVFCKAMQFSIPETVALVGCHVLFIQLTRQKWSKRKWDGPEQYINEDGELMMLPTDMALLEEPWRKWVDIYAEDKDRFFKEFAVAFNKLIELGIPLDQSKL